MKTKVLSLNLDKSSSFTRFQVKLESSIKPFVKDCEFFEYDDIREIFVALQSALESEKLVITAVDAKYYLKFKNALIQAFGTEVVYNSSVLNKIESLEIDDKKKKAFSAFPEPATVFVTSDGLYSGMAMENSDQYLVLLPIDNDRIDDILRNGLEPYFSKHFGNSISYTDFVSNISEADKVSFAINSIIESNSLVAVNGTKNAEAIKSLGSDIEGFKDAFIFTPYVEDKGNVNPTEYTAQLARASLDLSAANIGACISDIYTSGDLKFICIAVSKDDTALVRKLYMAENETEEELVKSAAFELIELVAEKASGKRSVGIEISDENSISDDDKKIVNKKPLAILAIVIGIVIIICAVIGIIFQSQKDGDSGNIFGSLFNKEETTAETTTLAPAPSTTESTTVATPEYDPDLMRLSDYIVAQIMSMDEAEIAAKAANINSSAPEFITVNGTKMYAKDAIAKLVSAELGSGYNSEAVKAQTVVIYSCLKFLGNDFNIDGVRIAESYNSIIERAVDEVYGEYLTYNNTLALPIYHYLSAGSTHDVSSKLPYLKSVKLENAIDANARDYRSEKIYSADEMKALLLKYDSSLVLSDDPAEWIVVKSHDSSISPDTGYVTSVVVNGVEMSGIDFRMNVMGTDVLPSLCFIITHEKTYNDRFIVKTFGQGYGIGMSQFGAKKMAADGNDYKAIIAKYYEGTTIAKEANV